MEPITITGTETGTGIMTTPTKKPQAMKTSMSNNIFKSFSITQKKYDGFEHVFVANSGQPDSVNEVIPVGAWSLDRFKANPVIMYNHNGYWSNDPDDIIAKGEAFIEGENLMIGIKKYDSTDHAQKIKQKVNDGFLNTVSVGFIEKSPGEIVTVGDQQVYKYSSTELLEVSIVGLPADPKATRVKSIGNTITAPTPVEVQETKPVSKNSDWIIALKKWSIERGRVLFIKQNHEKK